MTSWKGLHFELWAMEAVVICASMSPRKTKTFLMKTLLLSIFTTLLLLVASCASVDSRVSDHQAAFDTWPADVQEKVRAGKVEMGFTQEMVEVALGKPDRVSSRTTDRGQADVWIYHESAPKFSVGLGFGSSRGSTGMGAGVRVGDDFRDDENMRVVFEGGKVTAIETRK
jgi:hypothetical protein